MAADLIANGAFTTDPSSDWTKVELGNPSNGDLGWDSGVGNPSGSMGHWVNVGRRTAWSGESTQTIGSTITSGSTVNLSLWWQKQSVAVQAMTNDIWIEIRKPSGSVVTIWGPETSIPGAGATTNGTVSNLDVSSDFDETGTYEIRLVSDLRNGNNGSAQALAWWDNIVLDVTAAAADTIVGDGTSPANKTAGPSYTTQTVSAFTLNTSSGADTVTEIQFTGTNPANVASSGVKLWADDGGTSDEWDATDTQIDGAVSFSGSVATFSSLSIGVTTSVTQYLITYDIAASPTHGDTLTGSVTAATATNSVTLNDNADAVITIDAQAPPTVTDFNAADDEDQQSTLTWTNPDPSDNDLAEVLVMRTEGSYPTDHTTGTPVYQDASPTEGGSVNFVDTGRTNGVTYFYAVFSLDNYGNWNDTVDSTIPNVNADTAVPATVTTVGDGATPANKTAGPSYTTQTVSAFTLSTSSGADTVTEIQFTGTNTSNVASSGVKLWADDGGTPNEWDATDTQINGAVSFSGGIATFSGLSIGVTVATPQYLITYDIAASPTHGDTLSGSVTSATATNPVTLNDTADAIITIDAQAPPTVTDFDATDNEDQQSTLTWTNPDPSDNDLAEVLVMRTEGSYPTDHTTGTPVYQDASPTEGGSVNFVDTGRTNGVTYFYAVFSLDNYGNWNDTVDSTIPNVNADTAVPATVTTVGDGATPANKTAGPSYTTQTVSAFTLSAGSGVDTVTEIQFTGTNTSNVASSGVKLWADDGGTPNEWDAGDTQINGAVSFAGGIATFSSLSIGVTVATPQYLITYDIAASPTHGDTLTGSVTSATATNPVILSDTADAIITIDAQAPSTVTDFNAADNEDQQSTLTWTNPDPSDNDLAEVLVMRKEGSYPSDHTDGTQVYQDASSPTEGGSVNYVDTGRTNGVTYFYAVFSLDDYGNWNDTVSAGSNADTAVPATDTTVGDGASPANKTAGPSYTTQTVSAFTLSTASGVDTVTEIQFTGTNPANVASSGVKLWADDGGTPNEWDSSDTQIDGAVSFSGGIATFSGLSIGVTVAIPQYLITYDIAASPTHGDTLTGSVTSATATNPVTLNDNADAIITIDAQAPSTVTDFNAADNEDQQSTLTWTNPDPSDNDLAEVLVMRKEGSYPSDHTDGTQVYQDASSPTEGGSVNYVDTGRTNGVTYFYAVFSLDDYGNWNDTVSAGSNADTAVPAGVVVNEVSVYPTSVAPASAFLGETDVAMARFYLLTDTETADWTDVRVDLGGSGATNADIDLIKIYKSTDTIFSPGTDSLIGSAAVNGSNIAQIDIVDQTVTTTTSSQYYFIVYDVADAADTGHSVTAKFDTPGGTYFTVSAPDTVADTNLPFETGATAIQTIAATLTGVDTAPADLKQEERDDFLRFSVTTADGTTTMESLTVDKLGTLADAGVSAVTLWRSADTNFDEGADTQISSGSFSGGTVTLGSLNETVTTSITNYYFVVIELASDANPGDSIGARTPANGFTVSAGTVSNAIIDSAIINVVANSGIEVSVNHWNLAPRAIAGPQAGWTRTVATQMLLLSTDTSSTTWTAIKVDTAGTLDDGAIDQVRIYQSADGSFDETSDTIVATATLAGGTTGDMALSPTQTISTTTTTYYFIVIVINDSASIGDTIGTNLADETYLTVDPSSMVVPFRDIKSYLITIIGEPHGSPNNPGAFINTSLCGGCHTIHLAGTSKRILQKVFTMDPDFVNNNPTSSYVELCFSCHDGSGSSINIAQHYQATGENAGHKIDYDGDSTKAVSYGYPDNGIVYNKNTQLPCMICHDVHQSRNGNYKMLADELYEYAAGSSQNTDTASWDASSTLWSSSGSTDEIKRQRCIVCHRDDDGAPHTDPDIQDGTGGFADDKSVIVGIDMARPGSHADAPRDTQVCYGAGGCHGNPHNPGPGESTGNQKCSTCHDFFTSMNTSTTSYHHYLNNAEVTTVTSSNSKYPTKNLFGSGDRDAEDRRCLMCHVDHDIFSPNANPSGVRSQNLRLDATTIPSTIDDATNTDFVAVLANGGICLSCHQNSQTKSTTRATDGTTRTWVISKTDFTDSAHQYTAGPTATFRSDSSTFRPNCIKCHNTMDSTKEGKSKQSSLYKFELHDSPYRRLLAVLGIAAPSDPLEENLCFECHSGITAGNDYYGAQAMSAAARSIKDMFTSGVSSHPIGTASTTRHAPIEGDSSPWNPRGNRHVECEDCHNPHEAAAGNSQEGSAAVGLSQKGVWGVKPTYSLYNTGTASFTNASTNVTGSGTSWTSSLEGQFIKNTWDMAGRWYEITTVVSGTQLTLNTNYDATFSSPDGDTRLSGVAYTIGGVEYERTAEAANQYEICLKCHSSYAFGDSPPDVPSGMADGSTIEETDIALDFNTEQMAIHPVTALGKNQPIAVNGTGSDQYSAWNPDWPKFTSGSVTITASNPAVATFSQATPETVIPGWYLKFGATTPPDGPQNGWYQVTRVIDSQTMEVTPTPSAQQGPNPSFTLTAGLGNAFVAPWGPWSRVVCSDCHSADGAADPSGPHGSAQPWILREADPDISFTWYYNSTTYTVEPNKNMRVGGHNPNQPLTATSVIFCYNCHRRDVYGDIDQNGADADNPNIPGSATAYQGRVSHDVTGQARTYRVVGGGWGPGSAESGNKWGNTPGILCMMCHGGDSLGGIHGTSSKIGRGGTANRGERFLNGATWNGVTRAATTGQQVRCWLKGGEDEVNYCAQGHSNSGGNYANYDWP